MTKGKDGLQNLVNFMIEDIMTIRDEELLAETDPADIEKVKQAFERALTEAMMGGPPKKQRHTAIRARGNGFETVELDDAGKVIEPIRCNCGPVVHWRSDCPFAYGMS